MRADLARRHRQALPPCRDVHSGTFVLPPSPATTARRVKVHKGQVRCQVKSSLWHFCARGAPKRAPATSTTVAVVKYVCHSA